ncbi:hypothetical protein ACUX4X_25370, partial [Salmonella enterica]
VVNNSVDWLPFGYGSYFLLSLISLPPLSDGGFFLFLIKHGLKVTGSFKPSGLFPPALQK